MKRYLLILLLWPFLVAATDTFQGQSVTTNTEIQGCANCDTVQGQTVTGGGAPPAGNDFTTDSDVKAYWEFESGALADDSIGGNDLGAVSSPTADTSDKMVGTSSCRYEEEDGDYHGLSDALLDAGFPLKSGDSNKAISVCTYFKLDNVDGNNYLVRKGTAGKYSFAIYTSSSDYPFMYIGYNNGDSREFQTYGSQVVAGRWYHGCFGYQDSDKSYMMVIYDCVTGSIVGGSAQTGFFTNNINIEDGDWDVSRPESDIWLDDMQIFSRKISPTHAQEIRDDEYDGNN